MCVVSNVYDHYSDRWRIAPTVVPGSGTAPWTPQKPDLTKEAIEDFIRRLEEAKAQDVAEGNPDCGTAEKKAQILSVITDLEFTFTELRDLLKDLKEVVETL